MADYTQHHRTRPVKGAATPQSAPIPGREREMRVNDAGGYVFTLDPWKQLERFLILGTEGGTYYVGERELTQRAATMIGALLAVDGRRVVTTVMDVATTHRAPKQAPLLFTLAMAAKQGDEGTRMLAYGAALSVCGTLSTLKEFVRNTQAFGGWSHGLRRVVREWIAARSPRDLVYQLAKYQSRAGWSNVDLLRMAHVKPAGPVERVIMDWVFDQPRTVSRSDVETYGGDFAWLDLIEGFEALRSTTRPSEAEVIRLITAHRLTHEMVPNEMKTPAVWEALLAEMPLWAMTRNLATLSRAGLLTQLSATTKLVVERLGDRERIRRAKMHPVQFLLALKAYGRGVAPMRRDPRGRFTRNEQAWTPIPQITDALSDAFYGSFQYVEPTKRATVVAIDVSGSMQGPVADTGLTCHEAAAAMAMAVIRSEPSWGVIAFDWNPGDRYAMRRRTTRWQRGEPGVYEVQLSPTMSLSDVVRRISRYGGGGTDCSLPYQWAMAAGIKVEAFVTVTDGETWAGDSHPAQELVRYRDDSGINALAVNVAMTATEGALGDPKDGRVLEAIGFDATVPLVVNHFIRQGGFA